MLQEDPSTNKIPEEEEEEEEERKKQETPDVLKNFAQKKALKKYQRVVPSAATKLLVELKLRSIGGTHYRMTQHPRNDQTNTSESRVESFGCLARCHNPSPGRTFLKQKRHDDDEDDDDDSCALLLGVLLLLLLQKRLEP